MGLDIVISEGFARYVEKKVASGEYESAGEVVEHALRLLEQADQASALADQTDEEKLAWLRRAWDEGLASGDAGPLNLESLKEEARRRRAAQQQP